MTTETNIVVATYEHKHGRDIRLFASEAGAIRWAQELADEYWHDAINREKPSDPVEMASIYWDRCAEIGDEYYEYEWFPVSP